MNKIYTFTTMNYVQLENEINKIDKKIEDLKSQRRLLKKLQLAEQSKAETQTLTERRSIENGNREVYR